MTFGDALSSMSPYFIQRQYSTSLFHLSGKLLSQRACLPAQVINSSRKAIKLGELLNVWINIQRNLFIADMLYSGHLYTADTYSEKTLQPTVVLSLQRKPLYSGDISHLFGEATVSVIERVHCNSLKSSRYMTLLSKHRLPGSVCRR